MSIDRNRGRIVAPALVLILSGCSAQSDQTRRENMVGACIDRGQSPIDCAEAARIAIPPPDDVARCQRKAPPWQTAECGGRS